MRTDISYIVPAYAAEEHIGRAVRSALDQRDVATQVVVVDDASPDATAGIVARMAERDDRIALVRLARNGGPSRARNAGIAAARGRWIGVLDADDALEPERSAHLLDLAEACGAGIVADNLHRVDAGGRRTPAFPQGRQPYAFLLEPPAYLRGNVPMSGGFASGYLKPVFRRSLIQDPSSGAGVRYNEDVRIGEDFLFCLEAMLSGGLYIVSSRPGYLYTSRPGSLSHRIGPESIDCLRDGIMRLHERQGGFADEATSEAFDAYLAGLARARSFLSIANCARDGDYRGAAAVARRDPGAWPLVARYGLEAAAKRVWRRRAGEAAHGRADVTP